MGVLILIVIVIVIAIAFSDNSRSVKDNNAKCPRCGGYGLIFRGDSWECPWCGECGRHR